jgi:hypothetical protein
MCYIAWECNAEYYVLTFLYFHMAVSFHWSVSIPDTMVIRLYRDHGKTSHGLWGWCSNVSPFLPTIVFPSRCLWPVSPSPKHLSLSKGNSTNIHVNRMSRWLEVNVGKCAGRGLHPWDSFLWSHCSLFILLTGGIMLKMNSYRIKYVYRKWVFGRWLFCRSATQNSDTDGHPDLFLFSSIVSNLTLIDWRVMLLCLIWQALLLTLLVWHSYCSDSCLDVMYSTYVKWKYCTPFL